MIRVKTKTTTYTAVVALATLAFTAMPTAAGPAIPGNVPTAHDLWVPTSGNGMAPVSNFAPNLSPCYSGDGCRATVRLGGAKVRATNKVGAPVIGILPAGQVIRALKSKDKAWLRITYNNQPAYVIAGRVKF